MKNKKDKPKKYLPHNKIIKATFYEDQKLIENNADPVEKTSAASVDGENTLENPLDNDQDVNVNKPLQERSLSPKLVRT